MNGRLARINDKCSCNAQPTKAGLDLPADLRADLPQRVGGHLEQFRPGHARGVLRFRQVRLEGKEAVVAVVGRVLEDLGNAAVAFAGGNGVA